jgi:hypothetical protein
MRTYIAVLVSTVLGALCTSVDAQACNNTTECESIGQAGTGEGLAVASTTGSAIAGATSSSSANPAVTGLADTFSFPITPGAGVGVYGGSPVSNGVGVMGAATGSQGNGVQGQATANGGVGVYGVNSQGTGSTSYGVFGNSGNAPGVYGLTAGSGVAGVFGYNTNAGGYGVKGQATGTGTAIYGVAASGSGWAGYFSGNVYITGTLTCGVSCNSDRRLKQNIEPLTGAIDKLLQLKGVTFEWKNPEEHGNHTGAQTGVIAQDVERIFPQWVHETEKGFKNVDPDARTVVALTVEAVRELKAQNDELRARVASLEAGRRPTMSRFGEGGLGLGFGVAVAGAAVVMRRKRSDASL